MKPFLSKAVRFAVSLAVLGTVLYLMRDKFHDALAILQNEVSWQWIFLAVLGYFSALALMALRLQRIFKVQNIILPFKDCYHLGFIGLFYNLMFPSAIGGDLAKIFYAAKHSGKSVESATAIFLDRTLGAVVIFPIACVGIAFLGIEDKNPRVFYFAAAFVLGMIFFVLFFTNDKFADMFKTAARLIPEGKIKQKLREIYFAVREYRNHSKLVLSAAMLSFCGQIFYIASFYAIAWAIDARISFLEFFILIPVSYIVSMAPSIGGLGVREAGLIYLFNRYLQPERSIALTLLIDLLLYSFSIGAGIWYGFRGGLKARNIERTVC